MYKTKHAWTTKKLKRMRLSDYASLVSFTFAMCGIIGATPMPSIIVRGPKKLLSRVKRVLEEQHMKNQYAIDVTSGPSFTIYYCAREDPAFKLQRCYNTVSLGSSEQPLSLCGTRMLAGQHTTSPSGEATVSCLLEIKGKFYALGPAHLFTQKIAAESQEHLLAELLQMDGDEDEGDDITSDDDDIASNNDDYDYSDDDGSDDDYTSTNYLMSEEEPHMAVYPSPNDLQQDSTDCDWAVTLIKETGQQLPNLYLSEGQQTSKFQYVTEVAGESSQTDTQPITERSVHILTSSSTKHGMLLLQFANISGLSGRGHCNVHIVSMDNGDGRYPPKSFPQDSKVQ